MHILVVEDERRLANLLRRVLAEERHIVDLAHDGATGLDLALSDTYDLVVLDLMLPELDGLEVCRRMREGGVGSPVLMLTARSAVEDRVAGLDAGADDYLVKPFDLDELAARLRAVVRRRAGRAAAALQVGDLELDTAARRAKWKGREVALSAREFALLETLAERPGAYFSRAQLEDRLYGWGEEVGSNAVEVHIHALRRKLDASAIRTVRGLGYCLSAE